MIFALQLISKEHKDLVDSVALLLVVGEETDHIGMIEANKLNILPDYLVVGEPTELRFGHAQKGALKLRLNSRGKAAHSGLFFK
jgi:acetylornithine deacetylase